MKEERTGAGERPDAPEDVVCCFAAEELEADDPTVFGLDRTTDGELLDWGGPSALCSKLPCSWRIFDVKEVLLFGVGVPVEEPPADAGTEVVVTGTAPDCGPPPPLAAAPPLAAPAAPPLVPKGEPRTAPGLAGFGESEGLASGRRESPFAGGVEGELGCDIVFRFLLDDQMNGTLFFSIV